MKRLIGSLSVLPLIILMSSLTDAQERSSGSPEDAVQQRLRALDERLEFMEPSLAKDVDDLMWVLRLNDIALVDKVRYTGPPPRVVPNPTGQGASNPVIIPAYTFIPKQYATAKIPLIVLVHGGVHGNFETNYVHIVRELVNQGYAVIAPEYRGSTGYGRNFWRLIDYGGLEIDDVYAGRQWMLENYPNIDQQRVGIIGWSHGGLIS